MGYEKVGESTGDACRTEQAPQQAETQGHGKLRGTTNIAARDLAMNRIDVLQ